MCVGGCGGKIMHAAVHIGVIALGAAGHRLPPPAGLLGGGAAVEIDQRLAIDLTRQNRKVGARLLHIESRNDLGGRGHVATSFNAPLTAPRTVSPRSSLAISGSASSRNAWIRRWRASRSGMPRVRR